MEELRAFIEMIAPTPLSVLITGPTGSGKELVAQALHTLSGRDGKLVAVNIAAIPDGMFEAEFFGHARGAFTGAIRDRAGLLTEAHRGTLFLDEVGSFSPWMQPKLLRVLETRRFRPVGARVDQSSEFRTIAATNEDCDALVATQRFRRDLRRRLSEFVIRVPALSERRSDIPMLARHFASGAVISQDAMQVLEAYDWPDNVRELRQVVECGLALGDRGRLNAHNVRVAMGDRMARATTARVNRAALARRRLMALLQECGGDTALAAKRAGVDRSTIYRRMSRWGIQVHDLDADHSITRKLNWPSSCADAKSMVLPSGTSPRDVT
jgi:DNA-binding NtrC family response regulator